MTSNDPIGMANVQPPKPGAVLKIDQMATGGFSIKTRVGNTWSPADYASTIEMAEARVRQLAEEMRKAAEKPFAPREYGIDGKEIS